MKYKISLFCLGKLFFTALLLCHCFLSMAGVRKSNGPDTMRYKEAGQRSGDGGLNNTSILAQDKLKGRVTDTVGHPIAGVSVMLKGGVLGTQTDTDGNFAIAVPNEAATLVFSSVGYITREIPVTPGNNVLNIVLHTNIKALDQVVVVGYGTQKKVNVTGSVASVNFDEKLSDRAISNASSALQGLLPGLAVNQSSGMAGNNSATLLIRGLSTLSSAKGPLIVVDGMPDVDIDRLNINDIKSVSVLKDATAASVYGSRGANGVILITTKSGDGKKPTISVSSNLATQHPTNSIGFMPDYARSLMVHRNSQVLSAPNNTPTYRYATIEEWMAMSMVDPIRYPNTDWFDIIMRDGLQQNYNISASGGNKVSNFYISAGVKKERGLQVGNDFTRYNARINYDYKIRKNIEVGARLAVDWSDYTYGFEQGFTGGSAGNSYDLRFAVAGVTPFDPLTGYYGGQMAYNENVLVANPLALYDNLRSKENQKDLNGVFHLEWDPFDGLKARIDYSLNYKTQFKSEADIPVQAYNFQQNELIARWYISPSAGVENENVSSYKTMTTAKLSYDKTIAENHKIAVLGVYSEEFWEWRNLYGSRTNRNFPSLSELDAASTDGQVAKGSSTKEGLRSYIGRINYSAFDKYLLELNARYDGSSRFYPGHQWGFFPSASVGWRFTEEGFLSGLKSWGINSGKLRISYGGLGNGKITSSVYEQREVLTPYNYVLGGSVYSGFSNDRMINQAFSWETVNVLNFGLDLVMLNGRLSTELDYYDRKTDGMADVLDISMLISGMYKAPRYNIGQMRNRGIEGNFTWNAGNRDFHYRINLNASYNKNKLENWGQLLLRQSTAGGQQAFLNMPLGFLYGYQDKGIAQNWQQINNATPQGIVPGDLIIKDLNGDGRISDEDMKADPDIQTTMPSTNFALNSSVSYKGFDLSIQLQGATGRKAYWLSQYNELNIGVRYAASYDHWNNPWSVDNRDGIWPRLNGSGRNRSNTTFWLDDLTYLRLRNVQVGYSLPESILKRIKINSCRVFVSGENLHTFTSYRGVDPESTASMNDIYPLLKSYSFGVNINL